MPNRILLAVVLSLTLAGCQLSSSTAVNVNTSQPPTTDATCDAMRRCPENQECYKFENKTSPICWTGDPCSVCAKGQQCLMAESYPAQIRCVTPEATGQKSGIRGVVTIGPTCPVATMPPTPGCDDRLYATTLTITNKEGKVVATVTSDSDGTFTANLPAGVFTISSNEDVKMPSLAPQTVVVSENAYTTANIQFDSGIR
jgi:hypothetical protein